MKKVIVFQAIFIAFLIVYSYSSRLELRSIKEVKSMGVNSSRVVYTSGEDNRPYEDQQLLEPSDVYLGDILERISMLRQHLSFQPSREWVDDVITAAEFEIKYYRGNP